ncbi:hypothetical protein SAMD00023353_5200010 [Rosellinia necatrix]|uniref:Uncharacterized protein n=1 Tax=Rosellinia necatrix TaxID=77044 RepID=A0A1S8A9U5_ROSNE|nr:hypothetical protein SAMD00023353_5200010 [Rosellinia necatrix]
MTTISQEESQRCARIIDPGTLLKYHAPMTLPLWSGLPIFFCPCRAGGRADVVKRSTCMLGRTVDSGVGVTNLKRQYAKDDQKMAQGGYVLRGSGCDRVLAVPRINAA